MRKRKPSVWSILYMIALLGLPTALTVGLVLDPEYTFEWPAIALLISFFVFAIIGCATLLIAEGILLTFKDEKP